MTGLDNILLVPFDGYPSLERTVALDDFAGAERHFRTAQQDPATLTKARGGPDIVRCGAELDRKPDRLCRRPTGDLASPVCDRQR